MGVSAVEIVRSHLYTLAGAASPGGAGQDLAWGGPEELDQGFSWPAEPPGLYTVSPVPLGA